MAKSPVSRQVSDDIARFLEGTANFADVIFGFPEESNESSNENLREYEEEVEENVEENKAFWESQEQLLEATITRTTSLESKLRQATKEALKEINMVGIECRCRTTVAEDCRNCLQREILVRLQNAGYNCTICKSKWQSSHEIPSGQHTYLEVVEKLNSKKGDVRVIIELNFRGEFEMARASEEYNRLIRRLPEVFVGKTERLRALIKILCQAAKKCTKEKKIHLAPWRKQRYMQAKWLGTCEKTAAATLPLGWSDSRQPKPKASMLTFDLLENMSGLRCPAVEVL